MNVPQTRLAIAELTATLTTEFDVATMLHAVTSHALACFDACSAVVILLDDRYPGAEPALQIVAEAMRGDHWVDPALYKTGPGPVSARGGVVTMIVDLEAEVHTRWPQYRQQALAAGVRGVRAFPVTVLSIPLGSLVIHTDEPWGTHRANDFGQVLADLTAIALATGTLAGRRINTSDTIEAVLDGTTVVATAVGILAEYFELAIDDARTRLIRLARAHDVTPTVHAQAIIAAHNLSPADPGASGALTPPPDLAPPRQFDS